MKLAFRVFLLRLREVCPGVALFQSILYSAYITGAVAGGQHALSHANMTWIPRRSAGPETNQFVLKSVFLHVHDQFLQ